MIAFQSPLRDDRGLGSGGASESPDQFTLTGRLILTDDGRLGRVRRVLSVHESQAPELEVEGPDGTTSVLSPRDVRFIYSVQDGNPERAA